MPAILTREEIARRQKDGAARYLLDRPVARAREPQKVEPVAAPLPAPIVVHSDPALARAIDCVAAALVTGREEQRAAIIKLIAASDQIAAALDHASRSREPNERWTVTVVARDPHGRIAEVQFKQTGGQ